MQAQSLLIVRNPYAGRAPSEATLRAAAAPLQAEGTALEIQETKEPGHAQEIAAVAARNGVDVVAVAGGDGTVHEVVNGLAGSHSTLAVIPSGTTNVWAKEAGIPRDPALALRWIKHARHVQLDLGHATVANGAECYFLLMCSTGLDAEVVRRIERGHFKRHLGRVWYGLVGFDRVLRASPVRTLIVCNSKSLERDLLFAVVGNTQLYGGLIRLASNARANDGLLDLVAFSGHGKLKLLQLAGRALRGGLHHRTGQGIDYLQATEVKIEPERSLPVQADGEFIGESPVTINVASVALNALIAQGSNRLISD